MCPFTKVISVATRSIVLLGTVLGLSAMEWAFGVDLKPPQRPKREMMFIDPDGTNLRRFHSLEDRYCGSPQWSPDGKDIAYDAWEAGETFEDAVIEIVHVENLTTKRLGKGAMPSWSPDGTQIVCHTYDTPSTTIVVMDLDGDGREQIMDHWGSPRWSPVGNRIISANFRGGLSVFDLVSGKEWGVALGHSAWQGLSISPNGLNVCFGASDGGVVLATLNQDATSATIRFLAETGQSYQSSWSPDSKRVVFNWRPKPEAIPQLYLYDIEQDKVPRLLPGQESTRDNREPSWSPDGKTILYVSSLAEDSELAP